MKRPRWIQLSPGRLVALALALGLVVVLALGPTAAPANPAPAEAPAGPQKEPTSQGAYRLGKVRILGVPVITVASPVVDGGGDGPDAAVRARVIEGNLQFLYRPLSLCNGGEVLAELLVRRLADASSSTGSCGISNANLLAEPDALTVTMVPLANGLHRLEAQLPGRSEPLSLLTVTPEDAKLNGLPNAALAGRWRALLEQRLRFARRLLQPEALTRRLRRVLWIELGLAALIALLLGLWRFCQKRLAQLEQRFGLENRHRRQSLLILLLFSFSRALLVGVTVLLLLMAGVASFAVPGQVPTALNVLLQPWGIALKLAAIWTLALAARSLLGLWLSQWASDVAVPAERRQRRQQRYRSLQRVLRRLVDLAAIALVGIWILSDIPGIQELSGQVLLAGGALIGALAIVFQGLLRDFIAGLVILFDDRYAIGDTVEISGLSGEVVDLGLLSTELRCVDQRAALFQNSLCGDVINHTKLRSGLELLLPLSHHCHELSRALAVTRAGLRDFAADTRWSAVLLEPPELRGVSEVTPRAIVVSVLLVTKAGAQWAAGRALRLQLLERLQRAGIPLAESRMD
jgi:small conductance mechanosensitive channel